MNESIRHQTGQLEPYDYRNSNPMSHREVQDLRAVKLYVRHELTPDQEVRFEEHYFGCRECARSVEREQAKAESLRPASNRWWTRLSFPVLAPATAALLGVVAFQNIQVIPSLESQLAQTSVLQPNTVITAQQDQLGPDEGELIRTPSVTIELNLPADAESPFYRVQLGSNGKPPIAQVVPAPKGFRLSLHMPSRTLGNGSYNVLVYGLPSQDSKDGPQIAQYHFTTKLN
jgi:hypothetical protein